MYERRSAPEQCQDRGRHSSYHYWRRHCFPYRGTVLDLLPRSPRASNSFYAQVPSSDTGLFPGGDAVPRMMEESTLRRDVLAAATVIAQHSEHHRGPPAPGSRLAHAVL